MKLRNLLAVVLYHTIGTGAGPRQVHASVTYWPERRQKR